MHDKTGLNAAFAAAPYHVCVNCLLPPPPPRIWCSLVTCLDKYYSFFSYTTFINYFQNTIHVKKISINHVKNAVYASPPVDGLGYVLVRSFRCASFPRQNSATFLQPWSFLRKALIRAGKTSQTAGMLSAICFIVNEFWWNCLITKIFI
jgi:hypothetical protein